MSTIIVLQTNPKEQRINLAFPVTLRKPIIDANLRFTSKDIAADKPLSGGLSTLKYNYWLRCYYADGETTEMEFQIDRDVKAGFMSIVPST